MPDEFGYTNYFARAEIRNPNRQTATRIGSVIFYDAANSIVGQESLFFSLDDIPPKQTVALSEEIFSDDLAQKVSRIAVDASIPE